VRQLLADNQGLLNRIFDIVFDVGADGDSDEGGAVAAPVYISPSQLADRRAAEQRRSSGVGTARCWRSNLNLDTMPVLSHCVASSAVWRGPSL